MALISREEFETRIIKESKIFKKKDAVFTRLKSTGGGTTSIKPQENKNLPFQMSLLGER